MPWWVLVIASIHGGTPAIVYFGSEHECRAAAVEVATQRTLVAACITGTDSYPVED
jgi:hypothetical protein